ncbi:hypothetical protein B4U78_015505 [Microbacterium esteraromaticum]|nr:hypothetical protein B4U78_015505 [Microbacterium esteraromaticum]
MVCQAVVLPPQCRQLQQTKYFILLQLQEKRLLRQLPQSDLTLLWVLWLYLLFLRVEKLYELK